MLRSFHYLLLLVGLAFMVHPTDSSFAFFRQSAVTQARGLGHSPSAVPVESEEGEEQDEALGESFSVVFSLPSVELIPVNITFFKNPFALPQDSGQLQFLNIPPPSVRS